MGIKGSKPCGSEAAHCSSASSPSPPRALKNKRRHKPSRVFQSSCLGSTSWYRSSCFVDKICDSDDKASGSGQAKVDCSRKNDAPGVSSNIERNNWNEPSASSSGETSSSPSSRILSRFSFVPGNISFKVDANHSEPSRMFTEPQEFISQTQTSNAVIKSIATGKMISSQNQATTSAEPQQSRSIDTTTTNSHTLRNPIDLNQNGFSYFDRRTRLREPTDGNVRFSRTLSVGRLRDRVLRRSSSSYSPFDQERQDTESSVSTVPVASSNTQDTSANTSSLSREARYHNLLEHRSNFLERRRRMRSQRVGSRFENLSGRERSCILSGQHRTGNCTCRVSNRGTNGDETSAGVSISRIVLLAEALFEVLDEIHQQSVVLSARNTVSSFGSLPAPCDTVEALPLKAFSKHMKGGNEEAAQCYICLVEYEEGDSMRILPCKHEFHKACVDKWLKDIHRICPLCRGDVCSG